MQFGESSRLAADYFGAGAVDSAGGVARVDDQLGVADDLAHVVGAVVGHQHHAVNTFQILFVQRYRLEVGKVITARSTGLRNVGVIVGNLGPAFF